MIRVIRLSESHRRIDEFASFVSTIIFNLSRSGVEIGTVTDIFFFAISKIIVEAEFNTEK